MINTQILEQIAGKIQDEGVDEGLLPGLRSEFSGIHFTWCSDDDIPNHKPVLEQEQFNLYLVDGSDHCLCLTTNLEQATGVVVAEIYPD